MDSGFILHSTERTRAGRTELHLVGRLECGETFAIVERRMTPFFYVRDGDLPTAQSVAAGSPGTASFIPSDRTTMDGAAVCRVETPTTAASQRLRDALHQVGVRTYEADVKLSSQFLMDHHIHGSVGVEGEWRKGRRVGRIYENPAVTPAKAAPRLSVLSLDIETDGRAGVIYAVGLAFFEPTQGTTRGEVLLNGPGPATALCFPTEEAMLGALRDRIVELDPDIITGWNVVDFDFRVLARRFAARGVAFDIGRSDTAASFLDRMDSDGITRWNRSKAIVPGRQVLDGLWLARMAGMGLEDYRLETVAQSVLGRGKRIDELPGETRTAAVERLYRQDPENLCAYCLEDTRLALEILQKEGLLELAIQKSLLIGTSLEQTSMSVASFEFLYTEHLHQRRMVAPTLGIDQDVLDRAPGGGIITPRAGLYRNVLAFDFKSLYPSIIRTFNIDPLTRVRPEGRAPDSSGPGHDGATGSSGAGHDGATGSGGADSSGPGHDGATGSGGAGSSGPGAPTVPITAPNGASFRREPGILPGILDRFFESREAARRQGDRRAVYAYKIVMNSFYGVLGTPGCRFAASPLAGAITTLGQHILYWARDQVAARGFEVIYGDTDSLFVLSGLEKDAHVEEMARLGAELAQYVNDRLADYLQSTYGVTSRLELEFESIYRQFFLPPIRTAGAKEVTGEDDEPESRGRAKGYAGLLVARGADGQADTETLEIIGMEAVRHDWTPLAQELQKELLDKVFHDASSVQIDATVKMLLKDLRAGLKDDKLTYRKALRKPVAAYTKSSPPHARAAALLPAEERAGIIRYVWTTEGPQPESRLSAPPDYEHYVQKQIRPIVESLAPYIGLHAESIFAPGGQLGLF